MIFKYALFAEILSCLPMTSVQSASLGINPVLINFTNKQCTEKLEIANDNDVPLLVNFKIRQWTQPDGKNHFEDTRDLVVKPSVVTIQPKTKQQVRIIQRAMPDPIHEKAYRVFIHEVADQSSHPEGHSGLSFALTVSIPLFVAPQKFSKHKAQTTLKWVGDKLTLHNDGTHHIHMHKIQYHPHQTEPKNILQYVLPKQTICLNLPKGAAAKGTKIIAHTNDEVLELNVPVKP